MVIKDKMILLFSRKEGNREIVIQPMTGSEVFMPIILTPISVQSNITNEKHPKMEKGTLMDDKKNLK